MKDTKLYSQIPGIKKPWKVMNVQLSLADDEVQVTVDAADGMMQRGGLLRSDLPTVIGEEPEKIKHA